MRPRLLQIISTRDSTGIEKQLFMLAEGLPRDQFDFHICDLSSGGTNVSPVLGATATPGAIATHAWQCRSGPRQPDPNTSDIPITVISNRWKYDPRTFWELKRLVERLRPDLIHAWMPTANAYALAVAKASGVKRFVAGFCRIEPFKSGPRLAIDRYIGKHSVQLTTNCTGMRDFYIRKGLPAEKFCIIPSGVEPFSPSTATRRQLLAELGLPENSRLIGMVSRLLLRNRVKDAIWAADLLKVIRKDVHLLVFGEGLHRDQLERFRDQVRIADLVHFLGRRSDLPRLMPHFDLLWSTNPYEGQSSFVLEAMACGIPVVAGDTPAMRDLVVHQQTGFLVPIGDRAGFARHAYQIIEDPLLANRLGQSAREHAQREFSPSKMIAGHVEMYRKLLDS